MSRRSHEKYARPLTFLLCLGMLAGVLIWAKLRLVTDIPRSAYAVPEEASPEQVDPAHEEILKSEDEIEALSAP